MVEVGQAAPDFTLRDHNGQQVNLSDYKGQRYVVLHIFPSAFTGG